LRIADFEMRFAEYGFNSAERQAVDGATVSACRSALLDPQSEIACASSQMDTEIDILGLGAVAVDDLVYVPSYPPADAKMRITATDRQCGGLTATALVAAARLGCRCSYAGVVGPDENSEFALKAMAAEGIRTDLSRRRPEARVFHSIIIVDDSGARTLFCDARDVLGAAPDWPGEDAIASAKVLFVDHIGMAGMVRAARIARAAGVPVVADIERSEHEHFEELMLLVDHLVVPLEFAVARTGCGEAGPAAEALLQPGRRAVVVTCGAEGSWYVGEGAPHAKYQPAFPVQVVDTTGCGDVFHGAYAAALVKQMDLASRVRFASAVAAIKATRRGGQAGCPKLAEVEAFLAGRP
jgi:sugar/nucleoside kinase (ribokinase family)